MSLTFALPDLGEGIHEGEVMAVHVSAGDRVEEGDTLLEIETDKAAVEIPSPYSATVIEVRVKPGDRVAVGQVLVVFEGTEGPRVALRTEEPPVRVSPEPRPESDSPEAPAGESRSHGPVPAAPATRRLARELGVALRQVPPSGPAGRVTADDVRSFAAQAPAATDAPPPADDTAAGGFARFGPVETVPLGAVRRATARQMAAAWAQIPHVTTEDTVDITALEALRQRHKADVKAAGGRLTLTVFALKAVTAALKSHPHFNASADMASEQIVVKKYYHIGVAVDTRDGLIVPVMRDVDRKSIVQLAVELTELIDRTRRRKVGLDQLQGGSFTVTNIGSLGGGHFSAIINTPQVAIFGMGAARMQPVVVAGDGGSPEIAPRLMLPLVLAVDHRVLDGADAVRFMRQVAGLLADPEQLLMEMA